METQTVKTENICRTCLSEDVNMRSLFSVESNRTGETTNLCKMLTSCVPIQIMEGDNLPTQVCSQCVDSITRAFSFKQLCERSDLTLRNLFTQPVLCPILEKIKCDDTLYDSNFKVDKTEIDLLLTQTESDIVHNSSIILNMVSDVNDTVDLVEDETEETMYPCEENAACFTTSSEVQKNTSHRTTMDATNHTVSLTFESNRNLNSSDKSNQKLACSNPMDDIVTNPDHTYSNHCENVGSNNNLKTSYILVQAAQILDGIEEDKRPNIKIRRYKRNKDFCLFCKNYVLNFSRHIIRRHRFEPEVQQINAFPPKNENRKRLLIALRKKSNFLNSAFICKPMKRSEMNPTVLPCSNCMGFYSSKRLYIHRKKCLGFSDKNHRSNAQTLLVSHLNIDQHLKETVFPRMRADMISLTAKKDELICAFGAKYLKCHRDKHYVTVTSRKMRELARLLMEVTKVNSCIRTLLEALKPEHFNLLISATKTACNFNKESVHCASASTALNLGVSIKQCCKIAIEEKYTCSPIPIEQTNSNLKALIKLIQSHWRCEMSAQSSSVNRTKLNEILLPSLVSDLKLLRQYLFHSADIAILNLRTNKEDKQSYVTLMETIFCRIVLLNKGRSEDLQELPLNIWDQLKNPSENYEKFSETLSVSQKALWKRFKCIIIKGKKGTYVPVLFSDDVQKHLLFLLEHRNRFVPSNNIYLFPKINSTEPLCVFKVIEKYAIKCEAKNPRLINNATLGKHVANLAQILSISDDDVKQLSGLVGIDKISKKLSDDQIQTAKVSKLCASIEKTQTEQFKARNEIQTNLGANLEESIPNEAIPIRNSLLYQNKISEHTEIGSVQKKKRILVAWTKEQKEVVKDFFADHIIKKKPPKQRECTELKNKHAELLNNKDWLKIKVFIQNEYTKKKKC
ncbi:hypothetical protein FQR65_LT02705 [Abscondita terminalis]|nr:hypothetical protein FQR65_LT02705 [Abscondita terminalis]